LANTVLLISFDTLYKNRAISFLVDNFNISVYTLEVDSHDHGKEILQHVQKKHNHKTVPLIFVQGKFIGGMDELTSSHKSGEFHAMFQDLIPATTQAAKCELEIADSKSAVQPLFWYPEKVNAYGVRHTGAVTCVMATILAVFSCTNDSFKYIGYALFIDFVLRVLGGCRLSPVSMMGSILSYGLEPLPRAGRPKQFAAMCGTIFACLASLFYIMPFEYSDIVGSVFMGMLAVATGMEGFLDFCVGCLIFKTLGQLGLLSQS